MGKDRAILRELAGRYAEVAADPRNEERRTLHTAVNDLRMIRPVVLIGEIPWGEFHDESLALRCEEPFLRELERHMRRTLYQWEHFPADMIVQPYIPVPKAVHSTGNGISIAGEVIPGESAEHVSSHAYDDQLEDEADLAKLHIPVITHDEAETERRMAMAAEALGDAVAPRAVGPLQYCESADLLMQYHGMDNLLIDMLDRPEFIHAAMERLTDIFLGTVRQFEALGLLDAGMDSVHCTAALNSTLPGADMAGPVQLSDTWGRGMAQVFAAVSADMHEEFDIAYMKRAMEPFGLVYYGCCEPLHAKVHILEEIPHLRKISVSPWADVDAAAEAIGGRYVAATKAQPSHVAGPNPDMGVIGGELRRIVDAARRNRCSCDIVLKDISTVGGDPRVLEQWERCAMEIANGY